MTAPTDRDALIEVIGLALSDYDETDAADIQRATDVVTAPVDATEKMVTNVGHQQPCPSCRYQYRYMLAASPYRKGDGG